MIYCVEDDSAIRDLMLYTLNASGFPAKGFPDSTDFWKAMGEERPELILLDIMLPGEDGITILKKLRASSATAEIPVLMATARGSEFDKVIGLDSGADDYLVKPFGMMEMVARIKAVLRRTTPKPVTVLTCGNIVLDEGRHTVTVGGKLTALTLKEYELLKLLMENVGQVFTREILLSRVWGQDYLGETRTVDVHIGTLRTKLAGSGELIETVRGVGYKMVEAHEQKNL
ncbi:MAG: winged helix-turn-helix domain-containing protein [Faecousia sp.]